VEKTYRNTSKEGYQMEDSGMVRGRGRPLKTIGQAIERFRDKLDLIQERSLWCHTPSSGKRL
jgi:hypothetical protein